MNKAFVKGVKDCKSWDIFRAVEDGNEIRLTAGSYKSIKLDTPIYMNQDTIYHWQVVWDTQPDQYGDAQPMSYDVVGVVSDKCDNIGKSAWSRLIDFYGISAHSRVWHGGNTIPAMTPLMAYSGLDFTPATIFSHDFRRYIRCS